MLSRVNRHLATGQQVPILLTLMPYSTPLSYPTYPPPLITFAVLFFIPSFLCNLNKSSYDQTMPPQIFKNRVIATAGPLPGQLTIENLKRWTEYRRGRFSNEFNED